jgi:2'-hydroxyisoflavone reductase
MRILVLGGSVFLGRAFVTEAQRRGHEVTVFNRGRSGPDPAEVEVVRGNREVTGDLLRLVDRRQWDLVVDTSGQQPRVVSESARALSGHADRYLFVSSYHAYVGWPGEPIDETSPRHACAPDTDPDDVPYNALKAGCERAVEQHFKGDALILNPGLIVGPYENTGRLLWWLERFSRGGRVLVPGPANRPVRLIDARDIAVFGLDRAEAGSSGRYLLTGPERPDTFGELFTACVEATGVECELVWVDDTFLMAHEVPAWTGLPMWAADIPELAGIWLASAKKAEAAGMCCRPLAETVRDTWAWLAERGPATEPYAQGSIPLGISPDQERELLTAWDNHVAGEDT